MVEGGDGATDFEIGAGETAARAGADAALGTEYTTSHAHRLLSARTWDVGLVRIPDPRTTYILEAKGVMNKGARTATLYTYLLKSLVISFP